MITKKQIKYIKSLQLKKFRIESQSFTVEGEKNVVSMLESDWGISFLAVSNKFEQKYHRLLETSCIPYEIAKPDLLRTLGAYKSNDMAFAIIDIPEETSPEIKQQDLVLALDDIRDPGNLGTIIRIADWYGISHILCSFETTELYNPKVISSSMGSILRVKIHYVDLEETLKNQDKPIWGTLLEGENIHAKPLDTNKQPIVIIGNESKGISLGLKALITDKITIPGVGHTDSLNAAVATGIICDNLFRQSLG